MGRQAYGESRHPGTQDPPQRLEKRDWHLDDPPADAPEPKHGDPSEGGDRDVHALVRPRRGRNMNEQGLSVRRTRARKARFLAGAPLYIFRAIDPQASKVSLLGHFATPNPGTASRLSAVAARVRARLGADP
jgi:hypothetical protein